MELYLDSANLHEIEEAFQLGYLAGLTTTPTFMYRDGHTDIDATILKLAKMVPVLQVEALGDTDDEIVAEAHRQLEMGLDADKTVFKIPMSLHGTRACYRLRKESIMVNLHLVYTLQQAYMGMSAGATYVCPLVGRLQDQGQDALGLIAQCVEAVEYYDYDTKIMFSSVRHAEHVRNAINLGVHTITVPWKVMKNLTDNHFTTIGTNEFVEHTRLIINKVRDAMHGANPIITQDNKVVDAVVKMSTYKFGAVTVVDNDNNVLGIFTDGDLRRGIEKEGEGILQKNLSDLGLKKPLSLSPDALLDEAAAIFRDKKVDTLVIEENGKALGMLDIQDVL